MWELIPITFVSILLAFFSEIKSEKDGLGNNYLKKDKLFWIIIAIFMVIFAGLRITYNDTRSYLDIYTYLTNSDFDFSKISWKMGDNPGFNSVSILLKSIGFSENGYLMFFAIPTYTIYIWFLHKYSTDFLFSIVIFFAFLFVFPLAAIKQTISMALCCVAVDRAIRKKWAAFVLWIIIAELFHAYAIMYFIVPLLFVVPWQNKTTYLWGGLFLVVGFALRPSLGVLLDATENLNKSYTVEAFSEEGVHPLRVVACLVPFIISFLIQKQLLNPKFEYTEVDGLFLNLSFLCGGIMFIALFGTANYFARLALYFIIFECLSIPRLINMLPSRVKNIVKFFAIISFAFFFYYSNMYSSFQKFDFEYDSIPISEFRWLS